MQKIITRFVPFFTLIEREVWRNKRVWVQALLTPIVTAILYIFVFGYVIGSRIETIEGIRYIEFVFPGIFSMNLIMAVFGATSFSIYFMKFGKTFEDFLILPLTYLELVISLIINGIVRGLAIMLTLSLVAFLFGVSQIAHPLLLMFYVILISLVFGLIGLVVGIWADNNFEKFNIMQSFIITPLSFLGGAFYSINMLPDNLQFAMYFNPLFYATDGIRYALTGYHDAPIWLSLLVLSGIGFIFLYLTVYIFKSGWKLRS